MKEHVTYENFVNTQNFVTSQPDKNYESQKLSDRFYDTSFIYLMA